MSLDGDTLRKAVRVHEDYIAAETLADSVRWGEAVEGAIEVEIEGAKLWISIERLDGAVSKR